MVTQLSQGDFMLNAPNSCSGVPNDTPGTCWPGPWMRPLLMMRGLIPRIMSKSGRAGIAIWPESHQRPAISPYFVSSSRTWFDR